jgi:hypothetical protein
MKYIIIIAFLGLIACQREVQPVPRQISNMTSTLFERVKSQLDYTSLQQITGKEGVTIYLITFKADSNRIYATSTRGEVLYERYLTDANNGHVDLTKNGETVRMDFRNGTRSINARTTLEDHGGTGFCQREKNEKFADCFKAESEEFCDSFVSCIALATQPSVSILIGIACSCDATK